MGTIYPVGVTPEILQQKIRGFEQLQLIFASSIGTIISTGIGPIVTASIILQLLVGAKMIDLDLTKTEDKALFQGTQKILTVLVSFFEACALVIATQMVTGTSLIAFTIFQIALGSILLMYLDEVVSKWGIGSGISLFIAGGVSHTIINASLNPSREQSGILAGIIPNFIEQMVAGNFSLVLLFPVIATIFVFLIIVYGESMRLEIPLSYGGIRGIGGRYPIKFFYVSNIPVILASALLMNLQLWAGFVGINMNDPQPIEQMTFLQKSVFYTVSYVTEGHLRGIISPERWVEIFDTQLLLHLFTYLLVFIGLCVLFGQFWVQTTGLDAETVAGQLHQYNVSIPKWRSDKRTIKYVLDKYIPQITIISSVAVGFVSVGADLMGAIGSGTGILLTVGILYRLYEDVQKEQMADMSPAFRQFIGKE